MVKMTAGRPTKLTPKIQEVMVNLITVGVPPYRAAILAGIHPDTYYNWRKKAKKNPLRKNKWTKFFGEIEAAKAEAIHNSLKIIQDSNDWKAHAWLLEKIGKEDFGKQEKIQLEHSGKIDKGMPINELKDLFKEAEKGNKNK